MTVTAPPDPYALMTRQARATLALGDFARAVAEQVVVAELLCRAVGIHPGERVLDVAAGSGNAALAAARRGAAVIATDFVPQLLQAAARRAQAEGLTLQTQEADAPRLPFADGAFDVVLSTFGVMFAPGQARAAAELLRVCRPGGRIGLTAWTPGSGMAALQAAAARVAPSPPRPGARSPLEWGTEARVRELIGPGTTDLSVQLLTTGLCGASPAARVEFNRTYVGPTKAVFDRLGPAARQTLTGELAGCLGQFSRDTDGTWWPAPNTSRSQSHWQPCPRRAGPCRHRQQTRPGQPGQRTTKEATMNPLPYELAQVQIATCTVKPSGAGQPAAPAMPAEPATGTP